MRIPFLVKTEVKPSPLPPGKSQIAGMLGHQLIHGIDRNGKFSVSHEDHDCRARANAGPATHKPIDTAHEHLLSHPGCRLYRDDILTTYTRYKPRSAVHHQRSPRR